MGLKVLHIIDGLKPGGAETLLYRLAKRPSDVRHEVVCLAGREWYSEPLEQAGVPVSHLSMDSPATAAAAISRLLLTIGAIILFLVYIAFYSNQPPA